MQELLISQDFDKFESLNPTLLQTVDQMLAKDIADIMSIVPQEAASGADIAGIYFLRFV